jgi:hypothetical protein
VELLRSGLGNLRRVLSGRMAASVLALTFVAGAVLMTQCFRSLAVSGGAWLVAVGNLLAFFASLSLWLEFCQLRLRRHYLRFFVSGLLALCLLPLIFGGMFSNPSLSQLSLLTPGILALTEPIRPEFTSLLLTVAAQLFIALLLFSLGHNRGQRLLQPNVL